MTITACDGLITATAIRLSHFEETGALLIDPWNSI